MREEHRTQLAISFIPSLTVLTVAIPLLTLLRTTAGFLSSDREQIEHLRREVGVLHQEIVSLRAGDCANIEDDAPAWPEQAP